MMTHRRWIDIHAHVFPGIDDGARTPEESCRMIRMAAEQGLKAMIATPHKLGGKSKDEIRQLTEQIQQEINGDYPEFILYTGQENFYHEELTEHLREGKALTMAGSRYVLVEFDPDVSFKSMYRAVRTLFQSGYWPVLAHMERYRCLRREENLEELLRTECLMQMNYGGLGGNGLNPEVRWRRRQVLEGKIHLLGTDMHRMDYRPPEVLKPWKWLEGHGGEELAEEMTMANPLHIINNQWIGRRR